MIHSFCADPSAPYSGNRKGIGFWRMGLDFKDALAILKKLAIY